MTLSVNRDYPGGNWETIAANIANDGAHPWIVTGPTTNHARFRVLHTTDGTLSDTSNADTRIANPGVQVSYPNGGETVFTGVNDTIRFERTHAAGMLTIEINKNYPNGTWEMLADNVTHAEYYVWRVMQPGGENCRLKITSVDEEWLSDESDGDFVMRAPIMTLFAPNGGDTLAVNRDFEITWNADEHDGLIRLMLNRNYPNGTWELISASTDNDGSFMWPVRGNASTTARVRVATVLDPLGTYVESASDFTIDTGTPADRNRAARVHRERGVPESVQPEHAIHAVAAGAGACACACDQRTRSDGGAIS